MRRTRSRRSLSTLLVVALLGCGRESESKAASVPPQPASTPRTRAASGVPQLPRSSDPRIERATAALERGELAAAQRELAALGEEVELERLLLGARACALENDAVGAVRLVEAAREEFADQAVVYATAAEIHAAAGRLESAEEELRHGLEIAGSTPALLRARGVLSISRKGGARVGLERLLEARALDPELPFCDVPLSQAHLLLGNAALAANDLPGALVHARAALVHDPRNLDALQLGADANSASGDFTEALEAYDTLLAAGRDVRGTFALLLQRGATAALLERDRPTALERYRRARELGLSDADLGFGAAALAEESARLVEEGLASYDANDLARAAELFERALAFDPRSLEAQNHLAVVLFKRGELESAARHWREVLDASRERSVELPEPVHLNLARALHQLTRDADARSCLEDYLAREPEGEWAEETREMLERLP